MGVTFFRNSAGYFVYSDRAAQEPRAIRVFYSCPRSGIRDAPIIIAMHGMDRAAAEFRDAMAAQGVRNGQIVLVPEFDTQQFPDLYAYNFGGVRLPPPSNTVLPREHWNFGIVDRLFEHVRDSIGSNRRSFGLFGNSAGAQYVLRYLALTEAAAVDAAVAANCGVYMLPDPTAEYPIGMGGLDLDDEHLRRYLGRRLVILLGDADNDPSARTCFGWTTRWFKGLIGLRVVFGTSSTAGASRMASVYTLAGGLRSRKEPGTLANGFTIKVPIS